MINLFLPYLKLKILMIIFLLSLFNIKVNAQMLSSLNSQSQQALQEALADEYQARAFYQAVIDKFGQVRPFSNIVEAENRHAQFVEALFVKYGLNIPEDSYKGQINAPDTLLAACQAGIDAEIANRDLYDRWLAIVTEPDIRDVWQRLRDASQNNHLPAFQRCKQRFSA